jgi:hypothetical protein
MTEQVKLANSNALLRFSLAGEGNALQSEAQQQEPLLANLVLFGQTTVWYGQPNTGKTLLTLSLILKAVSDKRIEGSKAFYVNADDSASGMAQKATILDDVGGHTLSPGYKGFTLSALASAMAEMAKDGSAKGSFIVIDTLKKVADLMSKKECAEFGKVARLFSMHGGTLLGLAHTNKNRSAAGRLIHAGTSDILEDFDCAYMLEDRTPEGEKGSKYVGFHALKRRGDNDETACFSFSNEPKLTYERRLLSVEEADPEFGNQTEVRTVSEADLIEAIKMAITHEKNKKMQIAATVSKATKASRRSALEALDKHTGPDPTKHLWDYERKARGAHVFFLHPAPESDEGEGD